MFLSGVILLNLVSLLTNDYTPPLCMLTCCIAMIVNTMLMINDPDVSAFLHSEIKTSDWKNSAR